MIGNPLFDVDFLTKLTSNRDRETYARITALTIDEKPIEFIEGRVTGGSVNVDGNSAVRRTCSLTVVAKDLQIREFYWGLKNKFKLEIGIRNYIEPKYPEIIWFKQGLFVITSFNTSQATNNFNINISGKDKMCLLNGDLGGALPSSVDFGIEEYHDKVNDTVTYTSIPIKDIIREAVQNYGNELAQNIIINDIEDAGLELLEYRGNTPIYLFREVNSDQFLNMTLNGNQTCYYVLDDTIDESRWYDLQSDGRGWESYYARQNTSPVTYKLISQQGIYQQGSIKDNYIVYDNLVDLEGEIIPTDITLSRNGKLYRIAKFEYGSIPGYRLTDLVFAGDLIANVGETLTSVLDKIKNMLGEFEYFYNIDGKFVFQKKKYYIDAPWNATESSGEIYADSAIINNSPVFSFTNSHLITAFQNNPNLLNLRNDYIVWGSYKTTGGTELPIHMRYAIDVKPDYYKSLEGRYYVTSEDYFDEIKDELYKRIEKDVYNRLMAYSPTYVLPSELANPIRQPDGSWSPGWWDIRDWHDYYKLLTGEDARGTMKWYSTNDFDGCLPLRKVLPDWVNSHYYYNDYYTWLLIKTRSGSWQVGHGVGNPYTSKPVMCTYYESYINEDGTITTTTTDPIIRKEFMQPYAGCTDTHTYLKFLKEDVEKNGGTVYFYNPNFPGFESYQDAIKAQVEKEYQELLSNGYLNLVDWREIIYQMAIDYRKHYHEDDFLINIADNNSKYETGQTGYEQYYTDLEGFWRQLYDPNPEISFSSIKFNEASRYMDSLYVLNGHRKITSKDTKVKPENAYVVQNGSIYPFIGSSLCCLQSGTTYFYRTADGTMNQGTNSSALLNDVKLEHIYLKNTEDFYVKSGTSSTAFQVKGGEQMQVYQYALAPGDTDSGYASFIQACFEKHRNSLYIKDDGYLKYTELDQVIRDIYNCQEYVKRKGYADNYGALNQQEIVDKIYYNNGYYEYHHDPISANYWSKAVTEQPESLFFWFDFLDAEGSDMAKYSVQTIGARTKSINDKDVKTIYYREIPKTIFQSGEETYEHQTGYTYIQLQPTMENLFTISSKGKSAKERIDELLYTHSYCTENVTITSIPVFHLEPNTKILVRDENSNIDGEFIVNKLTIPLAYNGTMSITAIKAVSNIN